MRNKGVSAVINHVKSGHKRAFTLLELLLVTAIIIVLVSIQSLNYFFARRKTREAVEALDDRTKTANGIMKIDVDAAPPTENP